MTHTVVIKLGTSSILDEERYQPKIGTLAAIVETAARLKSDGHRVVLVSSGAIGVGRMHTGKKGAVTKVAERQALAAMGQVRLSSMWDSLFATVGLATAQVLLTRGDLADSNRYYHARETLNALMSDSFDAIPIVNENDTVSPSEGRFGDNDTLSAITAGLVGADFLFICTDVDGLYTDNPRANPDARRLGVVHGVDDARRAASVTSMGSSLGTGGMKTKLVAAELATAAGIATVILRSDAPQHIVTIVNRGIPDVPEQPATVDAIGYPPLEPPHTLFLPKSERVPDHKWTILHALHPAGNLIIDEGAYERISKKESGGRLLPAGVIGVEGVFERLQAVRLLVKKGDDTFETRYTLRTRSR
ncbi:glutamate 5-kinase [Malassezia cuniculi]|uniref:Glutamate 5-kinase n=1 Tax=Malassezia cuniculi TaxID=948313 RepID=A0AAF0J7A2_9BASI|nr:glutamate 5-kinase [Malassezia cuniculi]